jgi:hypothetical protein
VQYFKHFTKMRSDTKVRRLFAKYGLEGYGLYNLIIESIAGSIETENPLPFLEETCDDIACFYNGNSAKIDEMVRFMIQEGLLSVETTENKVACFKIYAYLEQSQTRSEKIRELITAYKDKRGLLDSHECLRLSETKVIEEKRIEEEENRLEKKPRQKQKPIFVPPTETEVQEYVKEKALAINPKSFYDYYSDLDWHDKEGKKVQNWKGKALSWQRREVKSGNSKPFYHSAPKPETRLCPHCHIPLKGSACPQCYANFDMKGKEI